LIFGKLFRVHDYDNSNRATIKFEESVGNKVKKTGSSRTMRSLKENLRKWLKYKYRKMDADNFDEFLLASKGINEAKSLITMFNKSFTTKVDADWDKDVKFVENDTFTIVIEEEEYRLLWNKLIRNKKEKHRALELLGVRSLFKGKRVTGITFTNNDADLISKKCYLLEAFNLL
jgi:hypothetical protein